MSVQSHTRCVRSRPKKNGKRERQSGVSVPRSKGHPDRSPSALLTFALDAGCKRTAARRRLRMVAGSVMLCSCILFSVSMIPAMTVVCCSSPKTVLKQLPRVTKRCTHRSAVVTDLNLLMVTLFVKTIEGVSAGCDLHQRPQTVGIPSPKLFLGS